FESCRRWAIVILRIANSGAKDLLCVTGRFFAAEVRMLRMTLCDQREQIKLAPCRERRPLDFQRASALCSS
ncbi:MAG TPA: hypothetical protein VL403_08075, partial [Candidatus Kryptonia bacterium]|nr:hypothetical protein [Candidatus Kryptonia bacterium]